MKIGILTGGGDCPGLNAVIYGVVMQASLAGNEVVGIEKGWKGFLEKLTRPLKAQELEDLHIQGGTILFTSRTNPYKDVLAIKELEKRETAIKARAEELRKQFDVLGIDALIAVGGDDTLGVAASIVKHTGAKIIGVPKTIDNDLSGTDYTFGFWSAVQLASNTLENLRTTALSHQRIFVVEVMGRDAGWLTLVSGISSSSDIILLPEMPFDFEKDVIEVLRRRASSGWKSHIIACAEGAYPTDESFKRDFKFIKKEIIESLPKDSFGNPILSRLNISKYLVDELNSNDSLKKHFKSCGLDYEVRDVVIGHTMRSGSPGAYDRVQGLRLGMHAAMLANKGDFGKMVTIRGDGITAMQLTEAVQKKLVKKDSDLIALKNLLTSTKSQSRRS
ncbi:MAG TPA: ATP-dependent 6-phosphofructokinase [Candidatus Hodarchaeales archaeon]|nr:ATP-dependent 6-phosphofructokinase [Candidatus Hodarchaeales archaeon]